MEFINKIKRFIVVSLISLTGVAASYFFLRPKEFNNGQVLRAEATAIILELKNNVEKQPPSNIIWQNANQGDKLLKGEKIKTGANASAIIKFVKNQATLNIEQKSVVVIDESNDRLNLRLISGNLFVKQDKNNSEIDVYSGENSKDKIELKNAEASIGFNKNMATVDIIKGSAKSAEGSEIKSSFDSFGDLVPNYGEYLYYQNPDLENIEIKWNSKKLQDYQITLLTSDTRETLEKTQTENLPSELKLLNLLQNEGVAQLAPKTGSYFWKLIAINRKDQSIINSPIMKLNIEKALAPVLIYPKDNQNVKIIQEEQLKLDLKWNLFTPLKNIKILIAKDALLENILISDVVTKQTYYETKNVNQEGQYFWQVSGEIPGTNIIISSKTQSFYVVKGNRILSPELILPINNFVYYNEDNNTTNINFKWKPELEAKKYLLTIKDENNAKSEFLTDKTFYNFESPAKTKRINWSVQSIDDENKKSEVKEIRVIIIQKLKPIKFLKVPVKNIFYTKQFPELQFQWNLVEDAKKYQLKISNSRQFVAPQTSETQLTNTSFIPSTVGNYFFQLFALNEEDIIVAQSEIITTQVNEKPLPKAPQFSSHIAQTISANSEGDVEVSFEKMDADLSVLIEMRTLNNNTLSKTTSRTLGHKFLSMLPGKYYVLARAVDDEGRMSDYSPKRLVIVPEKSTIQAPTIRNIKIK